MTKTLNWNEMATEIIQERTMKSEGKGVDNFQSLWFDKLTSAFLISSKYYKKVKKKHLKAWNKMRKGPSLTN